MQLELPSQLTELARVFVDAGVSAYAVGGMVRNAMLSLPPSDYDIASAMPPEDVVALCGENGIRVIPKALEMGTVEIHYQGISVEHTTFRSERYARGGAHRPIEVKVGATLEEDAARRDFSINALYVDLLSGAFTDPTGGMADMQRHILRTTSPAPDTILQDDALRILRLVRLACEIGFDIDQATWEAAKRNAPQLKNIAKERRRDELNKILLCDTKYPPLGNAEKRSVYRGLCLLTELDVWAYLIPEMTEGKDQTQRSDFHKYTVMEHMFRACAAAKPTLSLRLGALLHDIGKPACKARYGNMHRHAELGAEIAARVLHDLRCPNALCDRVERLVGYHMYDIQGDAKDSTLRVQFALWGRELTQQLIEIRKADIRGTGTDDAYEPVRWEKLYAAMLHDGTPFSENELAITGTEIMEEIGIVPSNAVGRIKHKLFLHCARHPKDNEKQRLKRRCHDMING